MAQYSSASPKTEKSEIVRPIAKFHPSIWGDRFLNYDTTDLGLFEVRQKEVEKLKETARRDVFGDACTQDSSRLLGLIDAVERLGVSYHFERELEEALQHLYVTYNSHHDEDLYNAALRFRFLRQNGYPVSCDDKFNQFRDKSDNKFKECLASDIPSILSFYEAAHLRVHGEDILDEAVNFTTTHLKAISSSELLCDNVLLATQITNALNQPLQRCLERVQARKYISIYQNDSSHSNILLELAKLDFNLVQSLHKKELSEISRWWKKIDVPGRLSFARDRIVELYFWIIGVYFEPKYSSARVFLTKVIGLTSIMDDIYDAYGTFEELELFTEAMERWDINYMDKLPEYMQILYKAYLDLYAEFEQELGDEKRYRFCYAKETMKVLARAYFDEARWLRDGYTPSIVEYFGVALLTTGYFPLAAASLVGMGDVVTKEAFEWLVKRPKMLTASEHVCRYMDDIVSHKFEHERKHIPTGIECYVKQYGATEDEVYEIFKEGVVNAWKDINEGFLKPTVMPTPVLKRIVNFTRVMDFLYQEDDGYTRVGKVTKDGISMVLIDPVPL